MGWDETRRDKIRYETKQDMRPDEKNEIRRGQMRRDEIR
jgi:hypothetical protein